MIQLKKKTITELFIERTPIDDALREASYEMALQHKRAGLPIVIARDGKVLHVPADEVLAELDRDRAARQNPSTPAA